MSAAPALSAPRAARKPEVLEVHGDRRQDDYYWLKNRDDPAVLDYLEAENAYTDAVMAETTELQKALYQEIVGRIPQEDHSVPVRRGNWFYSVRYEAGVEYPIYVRRRAEGEAEVGSEQQLLEVNALAEGHDFYAVGGYAVSSGENRLAYAFDDQGRRIYTIRFVDLETGETLPEAIPQATGSMAWANDNQTLFYAVQHPQTLRSYRIYRHRLGTEPAADVLVFEEADDTFYCQVSKTKSKQYLMITSTQTLATEVRFLDAGDPTGAFTVVEPRRRDHEYHVDQLGDHFYIRSNDHAKNFRLMQTPVTSPGQASWSELVPHRDDVLLTGFDVFREALVLTERRGGLDQVRVRPWSGSGEHTLRFDEPAYSVWLEGNAEVDSGTLRFGYSSLTTPESIYDYDLGTRERVLRKRQPVGGGFDSANYETERFFATARDGSRIPISLVYRVGFERDGSSPLLLYGYGSYGYSIDPGFRSSVVSLLDRGFAFAIAHVRGGQEMGRHWYEDGKLLEKMNTFTDFIDCAEHLVAEGVADPERLFAMGGSAGGLLMGAVANLRPDLFTGIVASVPFVDVVTTMLDDSIPLTTFEYDEWGNPNDPAYYQYMLSYSPYDNVKAVDYPALLVTTGLHDSQVQYWEPAKWVAKLRATKTGSHPLLLKTNMDAGHGGVSGRFRHHRETALQYAFMLELATERGD